MYLDVPSITAKDNFVVEMTQHVFDPNFTTEGTANIQKFVHDLIGFYVIMEGIFFYAGFAMMLSMLRKNRMVGVGEQFQFILRDESVHLAFGADLINTIIQENPDIWTPEFKAECTANIMRAVEIEQMYVDDTLPRGIVGLSPNTIKQYVEHIADRRLERIGLERKYHKDNPFPWMSEIIDMPKEKNFFETRVTEYKTASLLLAVCVVVISDVVVARLFAVLNIFAMLEVHQGKCQAGKHRKHENIGYRVPGLAVERLDKPGHERTLLCSAVAYMSCTTLCTTMSTII
jgi:ribonucleoside-diphosphate reductase beta chain